MTENIRRYWRMFTDRRQSVPIIYFAVVFIPMAFIVPAVAKGSLNLTLFFFLIGLVFLGLYLYVQAGKRLFGKK